MPLFLLQPGYLPEMAVDGSFQLELRRTKPYGYSLFNMDAFCNVAQILTSSGENLWEFEITDGKSIKSNGVYLSIHQRQIGLAL